MVLRGETRPLSVEKVVGPEAFSFAQGFDRLFAKSEAELVQVEPEVDARNPSADPQLRRWPTM
eukprot:5037112-Alexandrium_andersonii.AAC.1